MFPHFYPTVRPVHKKNSLSSNQTVLEGRTATFYCLTEAFPTATTNKWFKDGNEISNSQDFETLKISDTESRLTIKNAKKGSVGQYSFDGTNAVGTGDRKSAFLLVNCKLSYLLWTGQCFRFVKYVYWFCYPVQVMILV